MPTMSPAYATLVGVDEKSGEQAGEINSQVNDNWMIFRRNLMKVWCQK